MPQIRFSVRVPEGGRGPIAQPRVKARILWPSMDILWGAARSAEGKHKLYWALRKCCRASVYDPGSANAWRRRVRDTAEQFVPKTGPIQGPVKCDFLFLMHRPIAHYSTGKKAGQFRPSAPQGVHGTGKAAGIKPDCDNLQKPVLDGITDAGLWIDDAQVVAGSWAKVWSKLPYEYGVDVLITPLEDSRLKAKAQEEAANVH